MIALYLAPGASSMAAHIALNEIGAAFEIRPISFARQEQRAAGFLALNPEGKVPVLLIDGLVLTEVAAILFYLARRFPQAGLLPDDAAAQAQAISWMSFIAATVHPARQRGLEHARKVYALADRKLGRPDWILGRYSIADIHLFRLYWRFLNSLRPAPQDYPNLTALHDRMMAREAVQKTIASESAIGYELPA
ncbi:MAG: glutathione S-transferase family protein [Reyranellaceae bacterium]